MAMGDGKMPPSALDPEDLEEDEEEAGQGEDGGQEEPGDEEWQHIHRQLQQALQDGVAGGMIDLSNLAAMIHDAGGDAEAEAEWQGVSGGALLAVFQCCEEGKEQDLAAMLASPPPGLDINAPGPDGDTALNLACLYGHAGCVDLLLLHGAEPSSINDQDGSTVLHDAAAGGYLGICKVILGKAPELVRVADADGDTPLHNAARGNHADVVQLLLSSGADRTVHNAEGHTPCQEAEEEDVIEMLQV